jgi:predicted membrane protein
MARNRTISTLDAGQPDWSDAHPTLAGMARTFSLTMGSLLTLMTGLFPHLFMRPGLPAVQALLPVMCLGIAGGIVHGLGFRPRSLISQIVLSPWAAWPLMASSVALLTLWPG